MTEITNGRVVSLERFRETTGFGQYLQWKDSQKHTTKSRINLQNYVETKWSDKYVWIYIGLFFL